MSEIEKGVELTLKVLMKVKDDEIAAMVDEINHRDTEVEKLKKEVELLKAENEEVKRQRNIVKSFSESMLDDAKMELEEMKSFHQEEMKAKCERDLRQLDRQHKHSLNAFDLWVIYCDKVFNYHNLLDYSKESIRRLEDELKNHNLFIFKEIEEIEEMKHELKLKIKKMSEHQEAFLALMKDKDYSNEHIRRLEDELKNHNICILKDILRRFGCYITGTTVMHFIRFLDEDDKPRTYGDQEHMSGTYDYPIIHLYDYEFKTCDYCDPDNDDDEPCVNIHKEAVKPLVL